MNIIAIQKLPETEECILFFNGWGMDHHAMQHLTTNRYDVYMCNDYSDVTIDFSILEKYTKIHIVAWSMGVWACMKVQSKLPHSIATSIAINGTEQPMHDTLGIATAIFKGTIDAWNDDARTKFTMRMCGSRSEWIGCKPYMSERKSEEQKHELQNIYNIITEDSQVFPFKWSAVVIGERDLIFTAENQKNYWQSHIKRFILPIPHFPFADITTWDEILTWAE